MPVVVKKWLNKFSKHDCKVKPDTNDENRKDLYLLLFSNFINKNVFTTKEDVFTTLNLLLYDTLNKVYLAWYDEKDEIVQAQKEEERVEYEKKSFNKT